MSFSPEIVLIHTILYMMERKREGSPKWDVIGGEKARRPVRRRAMCGARIP